MSNGLSVGTADRLLLQIEARTSDCPMVETVWRSRSHQAGTFLSIASSRWELIVARHEDRIYCSVRGPETHPTAALCPPDGDWVGIHFKHGVFMPHLPVGELVDNSVDLPGAGGRAFWLHGTTWEFPTYDNAEAFIARLVKEELLVCDSVVPATLQAQPVDLSSRSVQRRFLHTTGLTHGAISQIERARLCRRAVAWGRFDPRYRGEGGLCRPTTPDPLAQAPDRPDARPTLCTDRSGAVVVFARDHAWYGARSLGTCRFCSIPARI